MELSFPDSVTSDFGTSGAVEVQFTMQDPGGHVNLEFTEADLGTSGLPQINVTASIIQVILDTDEANLGADATTAEQLRDALNNHPEASGLVAVDVVSGDPVAVITGALPSPTLELSLPDSVTSDFATGGLVQVGFTTVEPGVPGSPVLLEFAETDLGTGGVPTIHVEGTTIRVILDTDARSLGIHATTAAQLRDALNSHPQASLLLAAAVVSGDPDTVITGSSSPLTKLSLPDVRDAFTQRDTADHYNNITLTDANRAWVQSDLGTRGSENPLKIRLTAVATGPAGNGIELQVIRQDLGSGGVPVVTVAGKMIYVTLDTDAANRGANATTVQQLLDALRAEAGALIEVSLLWGDADTALGLLPTQYSPLILRGGDDVVVTPGYIGLPNDDPGIPNTEPCRGCADQPQPGHHPFCRDAAGRCVSHRVVCAGVPGAGDQCPAGSPGQRAGAEQQSGGPGSGRVQSGVGASGDRRGSAAGGPLGVRHIGQFGFHVDFQRLDDGFDPPHGLGGRRADRAGGSSEPAGGRRARHGGVSGSWQVAFHGRFHALDLPAFTAQGATLARAITLSQATDQIVVYFNDDDLHTTSGTYIAGDGAPPATVFDPAFYQLVFTRDTVRNTDDVIYRPTQISYDPVMDIAVLGFGVPLTDLVDPLTGQAIGGATYRLRIGTNETLPLVPRRLEIPLTAAQDPGSSFATARDLSGVFHIGTALEILGSGSSFAQGQTFTVVDSNGVATTFQFVDNGGAADPGTVAIDFSSAPPTSQAGMQTAIRNAVDGLTGVTTTVSGNRIYVNGRAQHHARPTHSRTQDRQRSPSHLPGDSQRQKQRSSLSAGRTRLADRTGAS
jgi:hypothetical protein